MNDAHPTAEQLTSGDTYLSGRGWQYLLKALFNEAELAAVLA